MDDQSASSEQLRSATLCFFCFFPMTKRGPTLPWVRDMVMSHQHVSLAAKEKINLLRVSSFMMLSRHNDMRSENRNRHYETFTTLGIYFFRFCLLIQMKKTCVYFPSESL